MLAEVRFWSERQVRSECPAGNALDSLVDLGRKVGAPSHDAGEEGSISWNGSFILRTDRNGEIQLGPRLAGRRDSEVVEES